MTDPDGNGKEYTINSVPEWRAVTTGEVDLITKGWDPAVSSRSTECLTNENPLLLDVADAPVHPKRITHTVLTTANFPAMREFYTGIGGLEVVNTALGGEVLWLRGSNPRYRTSLVLVKSDKASYHYTAFELADIEAIETAATAMKKHDINIAYQVDEPWKRSFFLTDPDEMMTEYYALRQGASLIQTSDDVAYLV